MCGIAGLINYNQSNIKLEAMLQRIQHRGPDADGIYTDENDGFSVALGHRRLSIIDLSESANQPFINNDFVLVFNGEIYNYKEIQKELIELGVVFNTSSDTEVVLESWRIWGENCLHKLRGMFAFAIYDRASKQVYIARDPFGIKPLFYSIYGRSVCFASELKAITALQNSAQDISYNALVSSLVYVWIPESLCIYDNIKKLKPGYLAKFTSDGKVILKKYWDNTKELLTQPTIKTNKIDQLEKVLLNSVNAHMLADVPVSAFLSGGLDSSLIVSMATKKFGPMDCYTIRFRSKDQSFESMPDDVLFARKVAKKLNCKLHEIEVTPDIVSILPKIVSSLDEPIGDAAAINTYLICKGAHEEGVKVLLSGMGADELFAGYRKHQAAIYAAMYRKIPKSIRSYVIEQVIKKLPVASKSRGFRSIRWAKRFIEFANSSEEEGFRRSYTYYSKKELSDIVNPELMPHYNELVKEHKMFFDMGFDDDLVNKMCFTDVNLFMTSLNLTYSDRASMAASTEIRVPFIDKEVVKVAFQLSGELKISNRTSKYILKKVAERWLPKEVVYRPKSSFSMPLRSWIRKDLVDLVDDYLFSANGLVNRGIFKKEGIRKLVEDDRKGAADNAQRIWQLLTLEQWYRNNGV